MKNPFKNKKPSATSIAANTKLGLDLTEAYLEGCTNYLAECNKNRSEEEKPITTIPITVLELYVKTFILADKKNAWKVSNRKAKRAYAKVAAWKSEIANSIYAGCKAYTKRYGTNEVPIHIVEGLVKLINLKIQS